MRKIRISTIDFSRREAIFALSSFGAVSLLAACGSSESNSSASGNANDSAAKTEENSTNTSGVPASTAGIGSPGVAGTFDSNTPYLVFGTAGAATVVDILVDYRCPHCKNFNVANGEFVKSLAEAGGIDGQPVEVRLYPRPMLDARTNTTFSNDTATAVTATYVEDPSAVWAMEEAMFALMPEGGLEVAHPSTEEVAQAAQDAGASDQVVQAVTEQQYAQWLLSVEAVGQQLQVGTPTVYINEQLFEGDLYTAGPLEAAIKSAVSAG